MMSHAQKQMIEELRRKGMGYESDNPKPRLKVAPSSEAIGST